MALCGRRFYRNLGKRCETDLRLNSRDTMAPAAKNCITLLVLPGILLAALCLVPFLHKAYVIDDPPFLLEAAQILKTPLQPWGFPICWMGNEVCVSQAGRLGANDREGLMGYVLVPVILAGGSEWPAHLIQIAILWVAILEMVRLTLRLGLGRVQAMFAGVLLVAIPPLLSMASTAMPDVLALALGLAGLERLLAWKTERRWHQAAAAGLALGLAPYARPHVALFLPLGALWLLDQLRFRPAVEQLWRQTALWTPVLIAAVLLVTTNYATRVPGTTMSSTNVKLGLAIVLVQLFAYLHYLSFPIPLSMIWLAARWRRASVLLVPAGIPLVFAPLMVQSMTVVKELELAAVLYGAVALVDLLYVSLRESDHLNILLSLWLLMPLPAIFYVHLPIKYFVPVLPAVVLILVRLLSELKPSRALVAVSAIIIACVGYSVLLLRADADFADDARRASAELIAPHVAAGEKVWFGGQWGFYWYALRAGAQVSIPGEPGPNPGDLLAVGLMEGGESTLNRFPRRELVAERRYASPHGRTMGYGAGLYSNHYGLLPWRWNPGATDVYQLWRVH